MIVGSFIGSAVMSTINIAHNADREEEIQMLRKELSKRGEHDDMPELWEQD